MGDPLEVSIRDYLALTKADIIIEDGLNVITGNNNMGKSSIFKAIHDTLFNTGTDQVVRIGKRYAAVKISKGTDYVMWRRDSRGKNEKTAYQISGVNNDKPFTKVGRGQLPEVADKFNIRAVRMANNQKELINFWFQGDHPFLVNRTPGQLFEFLSLSSCDEYIEVLKKIKADSKSLNSKITFISASIDTLKELNQKKKEFIDSNEGFDDLYKRIVILGPEDKKITEIEDLLNRISSINSKIGVREAELLTVSNILKSVPINDIGLSMKSLVQAVQELERLGVSLSNINRKKGLLDNTNRSLRVVNVKHDRAVKQRDKISPDLTNITALFSEVQGLEPLFLDLNKKQDNYNKKQAELQTIKTRLANLDVVTDFAQEIQSLQGSAKELTDMCNLMSNLKLSKNKYNKKLGEYNNIKQEYSNALNELEELKKEIGACPYCGAVFCQEGGE